VNRGECTYQIVGRYLRCETHSVIPTFGLRPELPCALLSEMWNKSFRSSRTLADESLKWSNTIAVGSRARKWAGGIYLGAQVGETSTDPGLHMLIRKPNYSQSVFSGDIEADPDLVRMNNMIYSNIILRLAETLGVDDYVAERLYLGHPSLYRGGAAVADYRKLGVSPGLLAHLREIGKEEMVPAARVIERYRSYLGWPRELKGDYQNYAVFNFHGEEKNQWSPGLLPESRLIDIFKERIMVNSHELKQAAGLPSRDEADNICFARISRSGRVTCERDTHAKHDFGDEVPAEVKRVVVLAFEQRIVEGGVESKSHPLSETWAKLPKLWRYIDQLSAYAGVATGSSLFQYLQYQVSPETIQRWRPLGIVAAKEILWADLIRTQMKDKPIGYIGVLAMVLARGSISAYHLASNDSAVLKKVIEAAETKTIPISYNESGLSARGITSGVLDRLLDAYPDWSEPMTFPHVKSLEAQRWSPPTKKPTEIDSGSPQLELGF
jgi:hypothetical protein